MCGNKVYTTEFWVFFNFGTNPYHTIQDRHGAHAVTPPNECSLNASRLKHPLLSSLKLINCFTVHI